MSEDGFLEETEEFIEGFSEKFIENIEDAFNDFLHNIPNTIANAIPIPGLSVLLDVVVKLIISEATNLISTAVKAASGESTVNGKIEAVSQAVAGWGAVLYGDVAEAAQQAYEGVKAAATAAENAVGNQGTVYIFDVTG